ncbi:MAG TPA: hypothetical protein VFO52_14190, partial [Longimicrobiales bacterium]|nr:hypothetical protein [Longimicrobiales bacterium]
MVPGSLQVMAGSGQSAAAGSVVPVAPSVKLLTTSGKPLAGALVTFAASSDGAAAPAQQTTNAQGVATLTSWTLPRRAGSHQLTVSSAGVAPVTITATATAGAAARLTHGAPPQQDGMVATELGAAPLVLVSDAHDNPVAGVTVRYTASG